MYVGRVIGNIEIEIFKILCFNIIYAKLFDYLPCHFFGGKNNLTAVKESFFSYKQNRIVIQSLKINVYVCGQIKLTCGWPIQGESARRCSIVNIKTENI